MTAFVPRFRIWHLMTMRATGVAAVVASLAAAFSAFIFHYNSHVDEGFLQRNLPDQVVFNVFVIFTSFTISVRTADSLRRQAEAAEYVHKLSGCWFDVVSTLCSFLVSATAPQDLVVAFRSRIVKLASLQSALCLDYLQGGDGNDIDRYFEVFSLEGFDEETCMELIRSEHKVEFVFQQIQTDITQNMNTGVLTVPAPILTRVYAELGSGLLTFHEAKKLACIPVPGSYTVITEIILVCQALFAPLMVATYVHGVFGAAFCSFCGTFLVWLLNGIAGSLSNPFSRRAGMLNMREVQSEFNQQLMQLYRQRRRDYILSQKDTDIKMDNLGASLRMERPSRHESEISRMSWTPSNYKKFQSENSRLCMSAPIADADGVEKARSEPSLDAGAGRAKKQAPWQQLQGSHPSAVQEDGGFLEDPFDDELKIIGPPPPSAAFSRSGSLHSLGEAEHRRRKSMAGLPTTWESGASDTTSGWRSLLPFRWWKGGLGRGGGSAPVTPLQKLQKTVETPTADAEEEREPDLRAAACKPERPDAGLRVQVAPPSEEPAAPMDVAAAATCGRQRGSPPSADGDSGSSRRSAFSTASFDPLAPERVSSFLTRSSEATDPNAALRPSPRREAEPQHGRRPPSPKKPDAGTGSSQGALGS